jgi:hypothetical protein
MQAHLPSALFGSRRAGWWTDLYGYWGWLNGAGHKSALTGLFALVCAHMLEHVAQAVQVWVLGWPRTEALGLLGIVWPWLIRSEWLHYVDVLATLIGLILLRPGFAGEARRWWTAALIVSVWHHFEHALLLGQALAGQNLFGAAQPTSVLQLLVPRIELHLVYNGIVLAAMLAALGCAWRSARS